MGWLAWTIIFIGMLLVGNRRRYGFLISAVGGVILMFHAVELRDWSLVIANGMFFLLYVRNFWHWKTKDVHDDESNPASEGKRQQGSTAGCTESGKSGDRRSIEETEGDQELLSHHDEQ